MSLNHSPRGSADSAPNSGPKPMSYFVVPLIVGCALFMEMLDSTVIVTALPAMARSLHENPITLNLAITAYLMSLGVFIPISGWVADRYGARKVFRCAIVLFTLGSMLCGMAQSLPELVVFRVLQGFGGAMMTPVGRLVVLRSVQKSDLVQAMSYLTVPSMLGPVVGPPVGGFIVTYYSWRWIFYINVPICILGLVLVTLFIDDLPPTIVPRLDIRGFALTGVGLAGLSFGFETIGRGVVAPWLIGLAMAAGLLLTALYVRHARRIKEPIVSLALLGIPTFRAANTGGSLFRMGMGAMPFLLALLLQIAFGLSPFLSGLLIFANASGAFLMKFVVHPVVRAFGFRPLLIVNGLLSAVSIGVCALFTATTPHSVIAVVLLLGGFFQSLQFTSLNALCYADVPSRLTSHASTFATMAQQLSFSFGVALAAMILHLGLALHGRTALSVHEIAPALLLTSLLPLVGVLLFLPLPADAGHEVSGRRRSAVLEAAATME